MRGYCFFVKKRRFTRRKVMPGGRELRDVIRLICVNTLMSTAVPTCRLRMRSPAPQAAGRWWRDASLLTWHCIISIACYLCKPLPMSHQFAESIIIRPSRNTTKAMEKHMHGYTMMEQIRLVSMKGTLRNLILPMLRLLSSKAQENKDLSKTI